MSAKKALIVLAVLGIFSGFAQASEKYQVVRIWPEAPRGWHFHKPQGVAVDKAGNVYVADSGNYRIKKFDSKGRFILQWGNAGKGKGQFGKLVSVKVDETGMVYTVDFDSENSRIQKFSQYGKFIAGWGAEAVGDGKLKFCDVAFASNGNFFVVSGRYSPLARILKFTPDGNLITQWGSDGMGDGELLEPFGIAVDKHDNVYVADGGNYRIQKFDSNGKFLAKWGEYGREDGLLDHPWGIAFGSSGDVYVVDRYSVQKFTSDGKFLARWGIQFGWNRRIAVDDSGNVYLTNRVGDRVMKLDSAGNVIDKWSSAGTGDGELISPGRLAVDASGNVLVAQYRSIHKFSPEGKFLSKFGSGIRWYHPHSMATDASGNLYALRFDCVQKLSPDGKVLAKWGSEGSGDGQIGQIEDSWEMGIAVDRAGSVYVADRGNHRVQKFTSNGKFLAKWGTEGTEDGEFIRPDVIAVEGSGNILVVDHPKLKESRIQKFDPDGMFISKWTVPTGVLALDMSGNAYASPEGTIEKYDPSGKLIAKWGKWGKGDEELGGWVAGICVDASGNVYVSDTINMRVKKFDSKGKFVQKWAVDLGWGGSLPYHLAVDGAENVYASDSSDIRIWKLSPDGKVAAEFRMQLPPMEAQFCAPGGMAVDASGNIYVVDSATIQWGKPRIQKFDPNGEFIMQWGGPDTAKGEFKHPVSVALDASGNAYVTDKSSHCIHKFDAQGKFIKSWGGKGTDDGQFDTPEGIAVDRSGNVYVCDRQNSRIQKFDSNGRFLAKWGKEGSGDGEFHFPAAVALDKEGNVYVADSDNNRIQKFTAEGKFLTKWGEFGEAPGQLNVPLGIAVDASGNVYVSDSHNHRIQKFAPVPSRLALTHSSLTSSQHLTW